MRTPLVGVSPAITVSSGFGAKGAIAQSPGSRVDAHVAAVKAAAEPLAVIAAMVISAFYISLAGRPLFREALFEA